MPDREKVIRGLTACIDGMCDYCPYYDEEVPDCDYYGRCNRIEMNRDALALLREQEEEREHIVSWLGKFCAHVDQQYQPRFTDEANIEFFRQKMKQQFGWEVGE